MRQCRAVLSVRHLGVGMRKIVCALLLLVTLLNVVACDADYDARRKNGYPGPDPRCHDSCL